MFSICEDIKAAAKPKSMENQVLLASNQKDPEESIEDWVTRNTLLFQEMLDADDEEPPVDDTKVNLWIIRGLGPEYDNEKSQAMRDPELMKDTSLLRIYLELRENELKKRAAQSSGAAMFVFGARGGRHGGRHGGRRGGYGGRGRYGRGGRAGNNITCYNCGELGHIAFHCPSKGRPMHQQHKPPAQHNYQHSRGGHKRDRSRSPGGYRHAGNKRVRWEDQQSEGARVHAVDMHEQFALPPPAPASKPSSRASHA